MRNFVAEDNNQYLLSVHWQDKPASTTGQIAYESSPYGKQGSKHSLIYYCLDLSSISTFTTSPRLVSQTKIAIFQVTQATMAKIQLDAWENRSCLFELATMRS